jgi:gliding motility-associated-like protein
MRLLLLLPVLALKTGLYTIFKKDNLNQENMKIKLLFIALLFIGNSIAQVNNFTTDFLKDQSFIENKGQYDNRNWDKKSPILYAYSQNPFYVFFSKRGVTYRIDKTIKDSEWKRGDDPHKKRSIQSELVDIKWIGANDNVEVIAEAQVPHYYSFAQKNEDESMGNLNNVKGFQKITYKNIYDFTDIEYIIHADGGIKYNIILHPGADPSKIQLEYNRKQGGKKREETQLFINASGQLEINSSLGQIIEHAPITHYASNTNEQINSSYAFENNRLSFVLGNYDNSKTIVIDPWIISPNFTTSTAVWEVETDAAGNIYAIGGETPMELKKYNTAGVLQWTYVTPWDTSTVWLGTLATDALGNSYITSGTSPEIERINPAGGMVWHNDASSSLTASSEFWSIAFNCDMTKLIVGGTKVEFVSLFEQIYYAAIFDIDINNGNILNEQLTSPVNINNDGTTFDLPTPIEVRSISSSKNARYIYLTHEHVGAINQEFGSCPDGDIVFELPNQDPLSYKCENYLPSTQNGGGLKALVANDNYFYTHAGNELRQWSLIDGSLINTVPITGGDVTNVFFGGGIVVHNSGLAVDNCGNVYAGSKDRVIKFDQNLNIIATAMVNFNVYDVSVNSNGEIIACGAQQNNQATNRNGRIESINLNACNQFSLVCCDANVCVPEPMCQSDPPVNLIPSTPGGTWSGTGVDNNGVFNPSIAGYGLHYITYTLPCGTGTIPILVSACTPLEVCIETNGNLTVSNGVNPVWYQWVEETSTPITNQTQCEDCGNIWNAGLPPFIPASCMNSSLQTVTSCVTPASWVEFGSGNTVTPPAGSNEIQVTDLSGNSLTFFISNLAECTASPCPTLTFATSAQTNVSCFGGNNGAATVTASGGTGPYTYTWTPGALSGATQSNLSAGTYIVSVTDFNNCPGSTTVTITQPATAVTVSASSVAATCGSNNGSATANASGGTGTITYSWSPGGGTTPTITNLSSGTYTVTVTDANGCTATASTSVGSAGGPTLTLSNSSNVSCNGLSDGSATVAGSGGTGTLTYNWMPGNLSGATQNALSAATYTVTVTDGSGCSNTLTVTISEPPALVASAGTINAANCGSTDGSASVNASGGTGTLTYTWTPNVSTTASATNIAAGSYSVVVADANGCSQTVNFIVSSIGGPTVAVTDVEGVSCLGDTDGTATAVATGGNPPFTYQWTPTGGTNATATGLSAGNYSVLVTDDLGCIGTADVTIAAPTAISITETITDAGCGTSDGQIAANASGGTGTFTYLWTPGGQTTSTITGLAGGNYSVTATDANGCTATENYVVNVSGELDITVIPEFATINQGETVQIVASGATTYSWTPTNGLSCTDCPNPIASPSLTTTYIVTGTDGSGCTGTATVTIFVTQVCGELFIPTVFSPNENGPSINNTLCVMGNCIAELNYAVFNRWGEKVFETTDPESCWDGTYKGQPVNSGVYAYKIYAKLFDNTVIEESGNLTVVR